MEKWVTDIFRVTDVPLTSDTGVHSSFPTHKSSEARNSTSGPVAEHGYVTLSCLLVSPLEKRVARAFARLEQAHYGNVIMNLKHSHSLPISSLCMDRHTNRSLSVQLDSIPHPSHTVTHAPCLCKHRTPHHCGITSIKDHIST